MRKLLSVILAILVLGLSVKDISTIGYFLMNQDFIANTLCINKDVPESTCNGTCYLSQQIKKQKHKKDHLPFSQLTEERPFVYSIPTIERSAIDDILIYHEDCFANTAFFDFDYLNSIFHPPQV